MKAMSRTVVLAILLASIASAQGQQPPPSRGRFQPGRTNAPGAVNTDPLTAPPRPSSAASIDLSGAWKGVYCSDNSVILADLTLTTDSAKRTLNGELRVTTLPPPTARGREAQPVNGSSQVSGIVDPGARTAVLSVPGGIRPSMPGMFVQPASTKQMRMNAVLCVGRSQIAGQFEGIYGPEPYMPYFVFARADAAGKINELGKHAASVPIPMKASGSPPKDDALATWSARYLQEYGQAGLGTSVDRISAMALPLLNDATFKPVFGESYDALDFGTLAAAMQRGGAAVGGGRKADVPFVQKYGYIQWMLHPSPPKLVSVAAMRVIDAWKAELIAHFQNDRPDASAFDDLAAAQKALQTRIEYAWPSDRKATDELIEQIRPRLSGSALTANVDRAISEASGRAGAEALASWAKTNAAMLATCPQDERDEAQKKIDAKLDSLLDQLLAEHLAKVDKLGSGPIAVRDGAQWYRSLLTQFAFAAQRPPVLRAADKLAGRREQDIAAGQASYAQQIAASKTTEEIDSLFARDLCVPGDETKTAFAPLAEVARERKHAIQEATLMSLFSADEKQLMDRPGHIDLSKYKGGPPSPESVRLALLRGWAAGTGTLLDAHTARSVTRQFSPLFLPFSMHITMSNERFTSAPVELMDENMDVFGGWKCEYTILMQMSFPQDNVIASYDPAVRRGADEQAKMINEFLKLVASTPTTEVFELYEEGWGVPSMREIGGAEAVLDALIKKR